MNTPIPDWPLYSSLDAYWTIDPGKAQNDWIFAGIPEDLLILGISWAVEHSTPLADLLSLGNVEWRMWTKPGGSILAEGALFDLPMIGSIGVVPMAPGTYAEPGKHTVLFPLSVPDFCMEVKTKSLPLSASVRIGFLLKVKEV